MKLSLVPISADPDLTSFNCTNASINESAKDCYLETVFMQGKGFAICIEQTVVGYYMFKIVSAVNYTERYSSGLGDNKFAAFWISYIAIDEKYQHHHIGTFVLKRIISTAWEASKELPIRYLAFEALPEKVGWYKKYGFEEYGTNEIGTVPMFIDFLDVETAQTYCDSIF